MSLVFEPAAPAAPPDPQRADVACFVGFVARRAGRPLPAALRVQLDAGGWVDGPWRRPASQVESLLNLPLALDSWHLFDRFYAWDERPVDEAGTRRCASYLGAAVRSFFARGGRRAIVIRVGDPWPYLEDRMQRAVHRARRLELLLPHDRPFAPYDPSTWQGLEHLYGLQDDSLILLPDLADACAPMPAAAATVRPLAPVPEGFGPCDEEAPPEPDHALQRLPAPRLNHTGYRRWWAAVRGARDFLAARQRAGMLVAALPLPMNTTRGAGQVHAQADLLAYLAQVGVLADAAGEDVQHGRPAQALAQLAWPWLRTRAAAADLPEGLEPPDGALAGLIAHEALGQGTFRSVAGDRSIPLLRDVGGAEPVPAWGLGDDSPDGQLAQRVCLFAACADGWALQSDVTSSALDPWRFGGASRLIGTILRAARAAGDTTVFEPNGPRLWTHLRGTIEDLLAGFWREGAFGGETVADAFDVRCDRSTMTQNDIDNGRLVVVVRVLPAMAIERITVVLKLAHAASVEAPAAEVSP
jgi:uncharacterized protein